MSDATPRRRWKLCGLERLGWWLCGVSYGFLFVAIGQREWSLPSVVVGLLALLVFRFMRVAAGGEVAPEQPDDDPTGRWK